ncbi:hypothetical protein CVT24_011101 [Panaeolus cyanescens]|uniref:Uncharacterized protein n=1 Tax=Panaeolus cyanescens TaxID=181874 RepID=A0A409YG26_9AGAR|nr:hypothetical protein CVT24_011101 [Panaeolus cyanescens]
MLRPITTLAFIFIAAFTVASLSQYFDVHRIFNMTSNYGLGTSPFAGYLERAQPFPNPHGFEPQRSDLRLAVLRNAPVEPEGFTLALFANRVAVDHNGHVFTLMEEDFDGILDLATVTSSLPQTGNFRNQWRIKQDRTSFPIDRILVPKSILGDQLAQNYEEEYDEVSVYGFDKNRRELQEPVEGLNELPAPLFELTGLALEARSKKGEEKDQLVLDKIKAILANAF